MPNLSERVSRRVLADELDPDDNIGELEIAEYLVFMLALDTYTRYVEETAGPDVEDDLIRKGIMLIRLADRQHLATIQAFLGDNLPSANHKRMLDKAFRFVATNTQGLGRRSLQLRTLLSRGGASTMRAVFKSNKALLEVKAALAASMVDDADAALDKFAVIPMRNQRLRKWIDVAAETAGSGSFQNAVSVGGDEAAADLDSLYAAKAQQQAATPASEDSQQASDQHAQILLDMQTRATGAAQRAMEVSGEPDVPPNKSEVVGIATAAVAAAMTDPSKSTNVPASLRSLDEEQQAAALTDGKVLVAAGAGAGKCIRGDTLVQTVRGMIPIREFAEHLAANEESELVETVLGLGGPEKTSTILNNGRRSTIRLTTHLGYQIEGTPNHPLWVLRDGELQWVALGQVESSDFLCVDRRAGLFAEEPFRVSERAFVKVTNSEPSNIPVELTPQVASLLGYIVSEGQVVYGHHSVVNLTTTDEAQLGLYKTSVEGIISKWTAFYDESEKHWCLKFYRKANLEALADFGLTYSLAYDKEVPVGVLRSPKKVVVSFLRALFDGDGGFYRSTVYYDSSSEKLARQIHQLLLSFGIVSALRFKPNDKRGCWNISLTGDNARLFLRDIGFNLVAKQQAAESALNDLTSNPNLDVFPGISHLFREVHEEAKGAGLHPTLYPEYGAFKCCISGTRNASKPTLLKFLHAYPESNTPARAALQKFSETPWFYDAVGILEDSEAEVYDFVVPGTHSFSAGGFVNHNSTTLVARIDYLVKERKQNPNRILACSFNRKAADELKGKIAKKLGTDGSDVGVQVGTMHSLFYKFITGDRQVPGFGTPEEQAMLKPPRLIAPPKKGVRSVSPTTISIAIRNIWTNCDVEGLARRFGFPVEWLVEPPKAKKANLLLNKWRGNDVSLEEAKKKVTSKAEAQAVVWYEMYMGVKGDIPGWRPPCVSPAYDNFMKKNRPGGERLGDLDDMLKVFQQILKRDPKAKAMVQGMFDHFLVDECQDLNLVQHQIFELMTEHIGDGSDGKSLWMIGDDKQAIYQFRGARPELFTSLDGKEGWKTRMIKTNYRCEPEIVDAANRLVAHNDGNIPMEARANPKKARGKASIIVDTPSDNTSAAIQTIGRVVKDIATEDAKAEDYAVLARTNAELNDFETACIINEIPYVRRGGKGFLEAPETKAVLGYIDLITGNDYEKMKGSLVSALMKPDRGTYLGPDDVAKAVDEALDDLSRRERVDIRSVSPMALLESRNIRLLADKLKQPYRLKIMASARGDVRKGEWMYGKRVDELADNLKGMAKNLRDLSAFVAAGDNSTDKLLDYILDSMTSVVSGWSRERGAYTETSTLREQITHDTAIFADDDGDEDETETEEVVPEVGEEGLLGVKKKEDVPGKGLGAVQFLYQMAVPNDNDQTNNTDPSTAQGFVSKIARYSKLSETLRIDPEKWEKDQNKIADPGQRRAKPPAITLSTVHSVKGLEWPNVSVLMPAGKFPPVRRPRPNEPPPDPVEEAEKLKAERNLAYVALTRAAVNLEVLCPMVSDNGMEAGISRFVREAGLHEGENVPKGEVFESGEKTAAVEAVDPHVLETIERYADEMPATYDRRGS